MIQITERLNNNIRFLKPSENVHAIYNPLEYAWEAHEKYIHRYASSKKKIIFLGMNPGPFGMVQTGIPFGEIHAVKNWIKIQKGVNPPKVQHAKRPIDGFECKRSEVSGRRFWGLFEKKFTSAKDFFLSNYVANYCPLAFMGESGANITPDKVKIAGIEQVLHACNEHFLEMVAILKPSILIGVGKYAEKQMKKIMPTTKLKIVSILHPSPANPKANKDWEGIVTHQLQEICDIFS